jgi:hypothetical protein
MTESEWLEKYLEKVAQSSEEGREAVEYVRSRNIKIGIKRARKSVGAWWTLTRKFFLNSVYYTRESSLENPRAVTLFVHEARHLQQVALKAISVYGELDAWQYEFRLYKKITGKELHPILEEVLALPLNYDRKNLRRVRKLMTKFAGIWYGAEILPLYPIHQEIKYWFTRKIPA